MKTVFMVPGQGSQFRNMGRQAYEQNAVFRRTLEHLSELAHPHLKTSITELLYHPDSELCLFSRSALMHPAIFAFHFAWAKAHEADGCVPDLWLGYSLGELTCCALAGAISPEDALLVVIQTAQLVESFTPVAGMMAVLGPAALLREESALFQRVTLACDNYDEHFVLTGDVGDLRKVQSILRARDMMAEVLPIDRGFHSAQLDPVQHRLGALLRDVQIRPFATPVMSCCLGRVVTTEDLHADFCWRSHRLPVLFHETIRRMESAGANTYVDLSATGTLAAFARRIIPDHKRVHATLSPLGRTPKDLSRLRIPER